VDEKYVAWVVDGAIMAGDLTNLEPLLAIRRASSRRRFATSPPVPKVSGIRQKDKECLAAESNTERMLARMSDV